MKLILTPLLCLVAYFHASASTWSLDKQDDMSAWKTFGTVAGDVLGPSAGDFAISGIASNGPISTGAGTEIAVKIAGFAVTGRAPADAENGNDLRLNLVLSPKSDYAFENDDRVLDVLLLYNSANQGIYASLQFKDAKKPNSAGPEIVGGYIGGNLSAVDVVINWSSGALNVEFQKDGTTFNRLSTKIPGSLGEMLKEKLYFLVYQQNIHLSQGTVSIKQITSASKP